MKKVTYLPPGVVIILLFVLSLTPATAQDLPGKRDSIYSDVLKEKRILQVILPENYRPGSTDKYEVLYVLDGDGNARFVDNIQRFTLDESYMPPVIVVAVHNTDRNRDFLPTHTNELPTSGGADKFLSFFKTELIPYINKAYPSNGENILFGHSFGGVFSMYALLAEPELFSSYLAIDPSFWWDNGAMNKMAAEKLKPLPGPKSLFITGRSDGLEQMGIPGMDSVLKSKAPKELTWKIEAYPNETHGSVKLKSLYDGLKFFYDGYTNRPIEFHPMNGIVLKDKPFKLYYFGASQSVHYSTDGTEPTASSPRMGPETTIANPSKVLAKSFGNYHRANKVTVGEFRAGKTLPAIAKPKNAKSGGLRYTYYEGEWDKLPDFTKLKAVQSGFANKDFDIAKIQHQTNFACLIEGYLEIETEGYYIFVLDSDDGSKFFLGNNLLIDYDGLHAGGSPKTFIVPLAKGFYPIRLEFFQKLGGANLQLMYVLPGELQPHPVPVPIERLYSNR